MPEKRPRPDLFAVVALAVVALLGLGGYFLFPALMRLVSYQDCIASGRITGC